MAFHVAVKLLCFVLLVWLQLVSAEIPVASSRPIAKHGCPEKCGNVSIPYPFGIGDGCFVNEWFEIRCNQSLLGDRKPTTAIGDFNVSNISILDGFMTTVVYTSTNCSGDKIKNYTYSSPSLYKFTFSTTKNKLIAIGCNIYAYIEQGSNTYAATKCTTTCNKPEDATYGSCTGIGCCQTSIPAGTAGYYVAVRPLPERPPVNTCNYGFLAEASSFNFSSAYMKDFKNSGTGMVPVVIDWSIGYETCDGVINSTLYACGPDAECIASNNGIGYRCSCKKGYEGNPYLNSTKTGGCQEIDECHTSKPCGISGICTNTRGSYTCYCPPSFSSGTRGGEYY
ncbi:hypothetical protein MKW98_007595, partial [Papaver atlanticum]